LVGRVGAGRVPGAGWMDGFDAPGAGRVDGAPGAGRIDGAPGAGRVPGAPGAGRVDGSVPGRGAGWIAGVPESAFTALPLVRELSQRRLSRIQFSVNA